MGAAGTICIAGTLGAAGATSVVGAGAICSAGAMGAALGYNNEAYNMCVCLIDMAFGN